MHCGSWQPLHNLLSSFLKMLFQSHSVFRILFVCAVFVFLLAYLCLLSFSASIDLSSLVCPFIFVLPVAQCSVLSCPFFIHKYSFLVFAFVLFFCLNYVHAALVTQSSLGADLLGGQILIVDIAQVRLCCHLFPVVFVFFFLLLLSVLYCVLVACCFVSC